MLPLPDAALSCARTNLCPEIGMKSILDPSFRYVSSSHTDLRKTFARVRREQAAANARAAAAGSRAVVLLDRRRAPALTSVR
jgi:hypothetical protein